MKKTLILAFMEFTSSIALASAPKEIQIIGHYFGGSSYGLYVGRMETHLVSTAKSYCVSLGETLVEMKDVKVKMNATFSEFENDRMDYSMSVGQSTTSAVVTCAK